MAEIVKKSRGAFDKGAPLDHGLWKRVKPFYPYDGGVDVCGHDHDHDHAYGAPYDIPYDASYDDRACHLCKQVVGIDGNLHACGRIYVGMPCCLFCN